MIYNTLKISGECKKMETGILADLVITKVYSAFTLYSPAGKRSRKADRSRWAIVIKYEGKTLYTSGDISFQSDKQHLVVLPKGCTYEWQCTQAGHFYIIEFDSLKAYPAPLTFFVKNSDRILKIFKELEYVRNLNHPMMEMESIRAVYSILLLLADTEEYFPSDKQKKIVPALDYISENYNKKITNDDLAAVTGLSTVYFRKLFAQMMHMSPMTYVHEMRIQKAKDMLKSDYGTLADVARALGYSGIYDFSRDFKKHTGISPSKY
ncbi:MAG: helix-turn-helix transcriptional regulator [Clostridiales bacterium]|nr:helix-turn-helix transcriptional regulator [Clostridiales bacterium]